MMKNKYVAEFAVGWQEWLEILSTRPDSRDARDTNLSGESRIAYWKECRGFKVEKQP